MAETIFFSWQSDTPPITGRNFIERCLEIALRRLASDAHIEEAPRLDRDTKGVPGHPPIVETIFQKIDAAAVFVPDLTFVGVRRDGRPTPNPNVLIEYGWALKSLTHSRIVPVMNTAYGDPKDESLPFDMSHLRHPLSYYLPDGATDEAKKAERERFSKDLAEALRLVLESGELKNSPVAFAAKEPMPGGSLGRFRLLGMPLGTSSESFSDHRVVDRVLSADPVMWLRVIPTKATGQSWNTVELKEQATAGGFLLRQLLDSWSNFDFIRAVDGFGIVAPAGEKSTVQSVAFIFNTGEIWAVDAYLIEALRKHAKEGVPPKFSLIEGDFKRSLSAYVRLLSNLGIPYPFRWIAGIEGLKGMTLCLPNVYRSVGLCVADVITRDGTISAGETPAHALKPFFEAIFDQFGEKRTDKFDEIEN